MYQFKTIALYLDSNLFISSVAMKDDEIRNWQKKLGESILKAIKDNINFLKTETKAMTTDTEKGSIEEYRQNEATFLEEYRLGLKVKLCNV